MLTIESRYPISMSDLLYSSDGLTLDGTADNDAIYGTLNVDTLNGFDGDDEIFGYGGNDRLSGGNGNDLIDGDRGIDLVSYADASSGVSVNLALTSFQNTVGAGRDQLVAIEWLEGSSHNDVLRGDEAVNRIYGLGGNDRIYAAGGNDLLYGGEGNDIYYVDDASQRAVELGSQGIDTVRSSATSFTLAGGLENLYLQGSARDGIGNSLTNFIQGNGSVNLINGAFGNDLLFGMGGHDHLIGGNGNDFLDGGTGNDLMEGGIGADRYVVDSAGDQVSEAGGSGYDIVRSSVSFTLGDDLEQLDLTGTGAISGNGNALNNRIYGNDGNNIMRGHDGDDYLFGRGGVDIILGGDGVDRIYAGTGNDVVNGGGGNDIIYSGNGADNLTGGSGLDLFRFNADDVSGPVQLDTINDFNQSDSDRIDLFGIDALPGGTNTRFTFIGTDTFTGAGGELRYIHSSGDTWIYGDGW